MLDTKPCGLWLLRTIDSGDSVFATPDGVKIWWDTFENFLGFLVDLGDQRDFVDIWRFWDKWDKWDKNGKILFNLTKLQLSLSQSLLTQEFWNMESVDFFQE